MSTRRPVLALSIAPKTIARRADVVAADSFGLAPGPDGRNEIRENAEMPVNAILRRERRRLDRSRRVEQAIALSRPENLDSDLIRPVPGQRAFRADETPCAFP